MLNFKAYKLVINACPYFDSTDTDIVAYYPYNSIKSNMKKWRKKLFPKQPETIQEMGDILRDPNNQKLLEHSEGTLTTVVITDEDHCKHLLAYDKTLVDQNFNNINNIRAWIDATYETAVKLKDSYQSLYLMLSKYDHVS